MSEQIARQFHDTYERLAPEFGYETREDTKVFDPQSQNGRLMIAVCAEVIGKLERERDEARAKVERYRALTTELAIERNEARALLEREWHEEDPPLIKMMQERDEARRLLAAAKESLNAIHVEVGGWIAEMMKEGK